MSSHREKQTKMTTPICLYKVYTHYKEKWSGGGEKSSFQVSKDY